MSLLHADVAVIGSELCGLAAGALLAHSHLRVVVFVDGESDSAPLGGRLVPKVPTLWRAPAAGPAHRLIEELGLKQEIRRALGEPVGIALVDDPDIRMVVEVEEGPRKQELSRVFGEEGERIADALAQMKLDERDALLVEATRIHEDGFFARRREKKRLEDLGAVGDTGSKDAAVAALLATPFAAALPYLLPYVQSAEEAPVDQLGGYLALCALGAGTVVDAEDGLGLRTSLQRMFYRVIQGHGGDVVETGRVAAVEGSGRKLDRVKSDGKNDYSVRVVVDATETRTLTSRLPEGRHRERCKALEAEVPPVSGAAIVRWLLPRFAVPRGLPPRTLILPDAPGEAGGGLLAIYDDLRDAEGNRPKDDGDLVAAVIAHWSRHEASERTAEALEERLDALFPFARQHLKARDATTGVDAWRALPTYGKGSGSSLNPLGGRRPRTAFANLFRAGRDLVPRLGLAGELAAARAVAAAALESVGKKKSAD